jgi:hypothetical protein
VVEWVVIPGVREKEEKRERKRARRERERGNREQTRY